MATTSKSGLRYDEFVKNIRPDPKSNDPLVMLQGYIGKSDLDGHVRVYSDPALSDFIDLPEREICYADPVKPEEDPLGGSRLWVRKTAVFIAGDPNLANRIKSSFLEGDLLNAFGGGQGIPTVVLTLGGRDKIPVTQPPLCNWVSEYFTACNPLTKRVTACICPETKSRPPFCIPVTKFPGCPPPKSFRLPCESYLKCPVSVVAGCPTLFVCPSKPACPTFGACPTMACTEVFEPIDPIVQQQYNAAGYAGGFNPYDTGNFGY